jgi:hypothetical protein
MKVMEKENYLLLVGVALLMVGWVGYAIQTEATLAKTRIQLDHAREQNYNLTEDKSQLQISFDRQQQALSQKEEYISELNLETNKTLEEVKEKRKVEGKLVEQMTIDYNNKRDEYDLKFSNFDAIFQNASIFRQILWDEANRYPYVKDEYDCTQFSKAVEQRLKKEGWKAEQIRVRVDCNSGSLTKRTANILKGDMT